MKIRMGIKHKHEKKIPFQVKNWHVGKQHDHIVVHSTQIKFQKIIFQNAHGSNETLPQSKKILFDENYWFISSMFHYARSLFTFQKTNFIQI